MKYMLLIYSDEHAFSRLTDAERGRIMDDHRRFAESIRSSGHYQTGSRLLPVASAKAVRMQGGKRLVTDGPFAETREQLGGYYLIEASGMEEAVEIAARVPTALHGTIEVRPLDTIPGAATNSKLDRLSQPDGIAH